MRGDEWREDEDTRDLYRDDDDDFDYAAAYNNFTFLNNDFVHREEIPANNYIASIKEDDPHDAVASKHDDNIDEKQSDDTICWTDDDIEDLLELDSEFEDDLDLTTSEDSEGDDQLSDYSSRGDNYAIKDGEWAVEGSVLDRMARDVRHRFYRGCNWG